MSEFLNNLLESTTLPLFSAFILGLMTAISPCPLATNITAIGYIGRDMTDRRRVFNNGLVYTLGRIVAYTALATIIFVGADRFSIGGVFQQYGERIIGPLLIVFGVLMLDLLPIRLPGLSGLTERFREGRGRYIDMFAMGILFALAFCPYSAVIYFGMLIPITITSASGLLLPPVFALATAIPVIIFAWLIAYAVKSVGTLYNSLRSFETWFRRIIALLFIGAGIYFIISIYF